MELAQFNTVPSSSAPLAFLNTAPVCFERPHEQGAIYTHAKRLAEKSFKVEGLRGRQGHGTHYASNTTPIVLDL
jgi:hypothetical protein